MPDDAIALILNIVIGLALLLISYLSYKWKCEDRNLTDKNYLTDTGNVSEAFQFFKNLGLTDNADENEIRNIYQSTLQKWNPDKFISNPDDYLAAKDITRRLELYYPIVVKRLTLQDATDVQGNVSVYDYISSSKVEIMSKPKSFTLFIINITVAVLYMFILFELVKYDGNRYIFYNGISNNYIIILLLPFIFLIISLIGAKVMSVTSIITSGIYYVCIVAIVWFFKRS